MQKQFKIGEIDIGEGKRPLFLPDIGTFFNKDVSEAKELITALKSSGVDMVKGEILWNPEICLDVDVPEKYFDVKSGKVVSENYKSLILRKILSWDQYKEIFSFCKNLGLQFAVSVYDREGADFAASLGASALKIASSNIVHQPLIEYVAQLDLPVLIDTGHSTTEEIARAINWFQDAGGERLVVEHSPVPPPAPLDEHNILYMKTLGKTFGCLYGLSDHHYGEEMLYAAVALGASIIEKGVCSHQDLVDQDVAHALPVNQVKEVLTKCYNISDALGAGVRYLRRDRGRYTSRMGLVVKKNLKAGETLDEAVVAYAWPALGIPVEHWDLVKGKQVNAEKKEGEVILWGDLCPYKYEDRACRTYQNKNTKQI